MIKLQWVDESHHLALHQSDFTLLLPARDQWSGNQQ